MLFVGRHYSPKDSSLISSKHKPSSFCEFPAWWKSTQTILLTKIRDFESIESSKSWKGKFYLFCDLPGWWKTTQKLLLTKIKDFEHFQTSTILKCKLCSFFRRPIDENYSNSSFDKSKDLNNQEVEKMKSICSNHIFEPTLSNHFLQIDVDLIEKLIPCSLLGGPFGGPACPPVIWYYVFFLKQKNWNSAGSRRKC